MKELKPILYYLLLSIIAVILIIIMVLGKTNTTNINLLRDKLLIAIVFLTSCIFGISIAIHPNWWNINKRIKNHTKYFKKSKTTKSFQGHHPDCNKFKNHIIIINNKPRCTGCLGLILGALASILSLTLYIVLPIKLSINIYYILFTLGITLLIIIYVKLIFSKRKIFFHILINSLLILCFLTITISVFEITKNLLFGILTNLLCFLWLNTRIHISNYKHQIICKTCTQECKSY